MHGSVQNEILLSPISLSLCLVAVMVLDHPTMEDAVQIGPGNMAESSIVPDYYTAKSYIIPTANLVIAPQPNEGYYDVTFEVCI